MKPKFKVGDSIQHKDTVKREFPFFLVGQVVGISTNSSRTHYYQIEGHGMWAIAIANQEDYELVEPNNETKV